MRRAVFVAALAAVVAVVAVVALGAYPASGGDRRIAIRVRLSLLPPVRFSLEQHAAVYSIRGDGLAAERVADGVSGVSGAPSAPAGPAGPAGSAAPARLADLPAASGPYLVRAGALPGEVILEGPSGSRLVSPCGLRLVPIDPLAVAFALGERRYAGELEVTRADSADEGPELVIVNRVDIESYVEGVLAGEVYPGWEIEALKAQAVAARTYALYRKNDALGRDYDVDDTVSHQRYAGGRNFEAFRRAATETRGEVLTYRGSLIKAHYFASSGGMTEGDEEVWLGGGDEPYLAATVDFDQASPHYVWQSPVAVWGEDLLARIGMAAAFPAEVEPAMRSGEKILAYRFRTSSDIRVLTREEVRWRLGLRSPRFAIMLAEPDPPGASAPSADAAGRHVRPRIVACSALREGDSLVGYTVTLDRDLLLRPKDVRGSEALSPKTLVIFDGVGYGHGVGLSQWGAQGMALVRDENGAPLYSYVDILKHFYAGVELTGNYGLPAAPSYPGDVLMEVSIPHASSRQPQETCELELRDTLRRD